jgi:hypothetical protein
MSALSLVCLMFGVANATGGVSVPGLYGEKVRGGI